MIAEGTIYLCFVLATIAVVLAYTMLAAKSGKVFELRKLPAIDALKEAVGRTVDMGGPVHWCLCTGRGRPLLGWLGQQQPRFSFSSARTPIYLIPIHEYEMNIIH